MYLGSLTVNIEKIQFIHANPAAKLQVSISFLKYEQKLNSLYKPSKETSIGESIEFPLPELQTNQTVPLKIQLVLLKNKGNSIEVGVYNKDLAQFVRDCAGYNEEKLCLTDDYTEKTYQPKVYLTLKLQKQGMLESPSFKINKTTSEFAEFYPKNNEKPEDFAENDEKTKGNLEKNKAKLTRSTTPKPFPSKNRSFVNGLAVGFVALLKKRTASQSPLKKQGDFLSKSAIVFGNEESFEIFEDKREEKSKNSKNSAEIHDKNEKEQVIFVEIETYNEENEKLRKENEQLVAILKEKHQETLVLPEMKAIFDANERLMKEIEEKNAKISEEKKKLATIFKEISDKQSKIQEINDLINSLKSESKKLNISISTDKKPSFSSFPTNFSDIDSGLTEEREKHEKFQEIFHANQEENERLNENLCYEREVYKEKIRENREERDLMRRELLKKDEKMMELERNTKLLNLLIVKIKEQKANIMNSLFETADGGDILVEISGNKEN